MRRAAVLAVDGGGSKLDAALLARDGSVLGAARVAANGYRQPGDEAFLEQLGTAVEAAARDAGLAPGREGPVAEVGAFCLSGADLPVDDRRILRGLKQRGWATRDLLRNDTFAVLRAGTERSWGVGVVCGYGQNCSGVSPTGRIYRFAALGSLSGDWGGGADLGEAALWHAVRAQDGRGPATALRNAVPAFFGLRTPQQVVEAFYLGRLDEARLPALAAVLFAAAAEGDAVARAVVDRQADELVRQICVPIRRLGMRDLDPDVVLGGGVLRAADQAFLDRVRDGIAAVCPEARVTVLSAPPVVGAAMLGLDEIGASRAAHRRVRRTLTHERLAPNTARRSRRS